VRKKKRGRKEREEEEREVRREMIDVFYLIYFSCLVTLSSLDLPREGRVRVYFLDECAGDRFCR